jgi:hypothetical protein
MDTALAGLCTGHPEPDLWFSDTDDEKGRGRPRKSEENKRLANTLKAIEICSRCPVKQECLDQGMLPENLEHGVWGGLMSGERIILHAAANGGYITGDNRHVNAIQFSKRVRLLSKLTHTE